MPLTDGKFPGFRLDGEYVQFRMEDGDKSVTCEVAIAYLNARAVKAGREIGNPREIFARYRAEIEAIASSKYDRGMKPLITILDL
jgi:hypothetical protein